MEQGPKVFISLKNNMSPSTSIAAIGSCGSVVFSAHKMPAARTTMPAFTIHSYLVYKI